jgi:putative FmdB family regulatory protein
MPTYEYECIECGGFTAMRPMTQCREPAACPGCGTLAPRVLATAPAFAGMPAAARQAHAINERSANEPRSLAKHGVGCSCCSGGDKKNSAVMGADGAKAFPNKRPWMISH